MEDIEFDVNNKVHNAERLKELQSLSLDRKIMITQARIIEWFKAWDNQCYVALSGGKDSTVCAIIAGQVCKLLNCKLNLWFSDTGLEYPEIKQQVDIVANYIRDKFNIEVNVIKDFPKDKEGNRITFRQVIEKYGYPLPTKQIAHSIESAKKGKQWAIDELNGKYKYSKTGALSRWNCPQWKYLLDAPFNVSNKCCDIMKKKPAKAFQKESGLKPIIATMASESQARKLHWVKKGCNVFDSKEPLSKPMSFWTEQDVLHYIKEYNIPIASVYGSIEKEINGAYYTTGLHRTGCMFCLFGCHLEKRPNRFEQMKVSHPQLYEYCMRDWDKGGLGIDEVLNYINVKH